MVPQNGLRGPCLAPSARVAKPLKRAPRGRIQLIETGPVRHHGRPGSASWKRCPGAHICLFYDSKDDLLDTCVPYFKAGLGADEFCVWAVSEPATEEGGARIATTGL